jgi:hypothetical protein
VDGQQASDRECPACKGRTGQWRDDRLPTRWWHECHVCGGKGRRYKSVAALMVGEGVLSPQVVSLVEEMQKQMFADLEEKDRQLTSALKGKRPFETKLADEVIAGQVKRIQELEEKLNGWFAERDALKKELDEAQTEVIGFWNALNEAK